MILFGFEVANSCFCCTFTSLIAEVDVLEIALREQLDLVDHVFIVEATVTHKGVGITCYS